MLLRHLDCMSDVVLGTCFLYALFMREPATAYQCYQWRAFHWRCWWTGPRRRCLRQRCRGCIKQGKRHEQPKSVSTTSFSLFRALAERAPLVEGPSPPLPELAMQGLHSALQLSRMTAIVKSSCVS